MSGGAEGPEKPVTVIVRHEVDEGRDTEFRNWMHGITDACSNFDGYLGTEVVRPTGAEVGQRVCIFRFDTYPHLERWMQSDARKSWLERTGEFSSTPADLSHYEGLDFWFEPKRGGGGPPSKHKMALVTFVVIWPMVHFIPAAVGRAVPNPQLAQEGISVLAIVLLMTYAVMPLTTRALAPWLAPRG